MSAFPDAAPQSMRAFLAALDAAGALRRVAQPVDPRHEVAACLELLRGEGAADAPALLFENVAGSGLRIAGSLLNSRARIAQGLGTAPAALQAHILRAIAHPLPPRVVPDGPCRAVAFDDPDLAALPIPSFFEHETGPYLTAGVIAALDPATGARNLSFARLKPLGGSRAFVGIAPNHHLAVMARAAHARGQRLPVAVTLGNHPAVLVAAALYLGLGDDEMEVAGALMGTPVDVVRTAAGLQVPAHCEIVLEGTLDAGETVEEGPVSEFHGMYERYGAGQVVTFQRLARRPDAILQVIQPGWHPEHVLLGGVAIAAGLARAARAAVPAAGEVAVGMGGAGRLHAVVALGPHRPGDPRKVMFALWAAVNLVKRVVVVDDDIDPWDATAVEWAIATRLKADRDLVVVPGVRADRSEPLEQGGVVPKLGLDATRKAADRADWTPARVPADVLARMRKRLEER